MFDPDWDGEYPGCAAGADEISEGILARLRSRGTAFVLASRAPLARLLRAGRSPGDGLLTCTDPAFTD